MSDDSSHGTSRSRFASTIAGCISASEQLRKIIAIKERKPGGKPPGRLSHSQPPWNAAAAFSMLSLHQLARDIESRFRIHAGQAARQRGGSDRNTDLALKAAGRLAEAVSDSVVETALADLARWHRSAKMILGKEEAPQRLPRLPGTGEPRCPFCKHKTLRMLPRLGIVICVTPQAQCHDDHGNKAVARVEYFSRSAELVLRWQDGIIGVPVDEVA